MERRNFCRSMAGITVGIGGLAGSTLLPLRADNHERESVRVRAAEGEIYELQAAFHRAKSTQDIDLMMSLWAEDASLTIPGQSPVALCWLGKDPGILADHRLIRPSPTFARAVFQDSDRRPWRRGFLLRGMPRYRRLQFANTVYRILHIPRRRSPQSGRCVAFLEHEWRQCLSPLRQPLLLPMS